MGGVQRPESSERGVGVVLAWEMGLGKRDREGKRWCAEGPANWHTKSDVAATSAKLTPI